MNILNMNKTKTKTKTKMNFSQYNKNSIHNLVFIIFFNQILITYSTSTSDMLFIRHGRSRVRHSNEKDHIRWGLKAFDNLTLEDYDITDSSYDNDTVMLFGSDLWANDNSTITNYVNQTNIYGQNSKIFIKTTNINLNLNNNNNNNNNSNNNNNNNNEDRMMTTQIPSSFSSSTMMTTNKKKLQKKKIMENIRKNVDKGLEYLKMHKNLQDDNYDATNSISKELLGYQNDDRYMNNDNNNDNNSNTSYNIDNDEKIRIQTGLENEENFNKKLIEEENSLNNFPKDEKHINILNVGTDTITTTTEMTTTETETDMVTEMAIKLRLANVSELNDTERNLINSSSVLTSTERLSVAYYKKQQLIAFGSETNSPEDTDDNDYDTNDGNDKMTVISRKSVDNEKIKKDTGISDGTVQNLSTIQNGSVLHGNPNQSVNMNISKIIINDDERNDGVMLNANDYVKVNISNLFVKEEIQREFENSEEEKQINFNSQHNADVLTDKRNENNINGKMIGSKRNNDDDDDGGDGDDGTDGNNNNNNIAIENDKDSNHDDDLIEEIDNEENDDNDEVDKEQNNNENDDDNETLSFNIYGTNDEDLSGLDEISRNNRLNLMKGRDVVTKFLQIVESQHLLGANCTAGTALNLGEGVVDQYAQDRFRIEAEVAVNRANMLTRIFKSASPSVQASEHLLHASVLSMVEFDDDIFAAGNCFDWNQHPAKHGLFCPFAYRLPPPDQGASFAKDLAAEYHYLGNTSEWFFLARKNAEKVISRNEQYIKAYHLYSNSTSREIDEILSVKYEDGRWSKPYYDCGGGNIWMLTYTVPFFGYENGTYFFKGTSGIDIDLRRVDIDQCPQRNTPGATQPLNIFAGTDKCKQRTTKCEAITGLGFRRGSYKCVCRKGFYYPDTTAIQKYFNGSILEEEYEKLMLGEESTYNKLLSYECLPCAEGCDSCEDASPCVAALNWPMRTSILVLACAVIGLLPPAAWFTFRYQQVKVVRAASPALLRVIALGAFFIYCTTIVMYPPPSLYTCTARIWLREIGFSLTYGALMLKTWRISVIFRVRSAKAIKITDAALLKRLGVICGVIGACLLVRTIVSPPEVVVGRTADDLKAFLCKTDWWDYTFTSMEVLFLAWGVRLCIMVRKAPSEFNESRFISMAIYNEFLLTCFLNVSMLFLQSPANPDLLYIIFFCHTQLTVTLLLGLIFGSKVYIVLRSGKAQENAIGMGAKSSGAKFNFRPQIRTFANPSTATTSTAQLADTKLTDQEALEEIRQLSVQLQRIQELAPPKGIAFMTISSLLDGLKTASHQISLRPPATSLPVLALNSYQHQNNKASISPAKTVEKSINTTLLGDDFWKEIERKCSGCQKITTSSSSTTNSNHPLQADTTTAVLICATTSRNNDRKYCDKQTSPTQHFGSERNLSFSDLQLECMCSQSDDIDRCNDNNDCCYQGTNSNVNCQNSIINRNEYSRNSKRSNRISNRSLDKSNYDQCTIDDQNRIKNWELEKDNNSIIDYKKSKKRKFYSSCSLAQTKSNNSSPCDNYKSNEHFLICDNCKTKIVHNEKIKIKLDSQKFKTILSPSSSSLILAEPSTSSSSILRDTKLIKIPAAVSIHNLHRSQFQQQQQQPQQQQQQQRRRQQNQTKKQHDHDDGNDDDNDDDISFHSSSNDDEDGNPYHYQQQQELQSQHKHHHHHHKSMILPSTSTATEDKIKSTDIVSSECKPNVKMFIICDESDNQQRNTEECSSSSCRDPNFENYDDQNVIEQVNVSGQQSTINQNTNNTGNGTNNNNKKGKNNRKSDKLVLDLNDRSKYTKEVSV